MNEALEEIDVTGLEDDNEKLGKKFKEAVCYTRSYIMQSVIISRPVMTIQQSMAG